MKIAFFLALFLTGGVFAGYTNTAGEVRFEILGDRTGGAVQGVYEAAWRETDRDRPDFVVTVGDSIQGGDDLTMDAEWQQVMKQLAPYARYKIFFTPGNHDIWSIASALAFEKYTKRPAHYSFDYQQVHLTVLDNSRSDEMPAEELAFLEKDLQLHRQQPVKFIFSHRPSWILHAVLGDPSFPLHRLAKRYGVRYIVAGHLHQMLHVELDGVTYLSMASSGGHLRDDKAYAKGWFFEHTLVTVKGDSAQFKIKELDAPYGQGRVTSPADWSMVGLAGK